MMAMMWTLARGSRRTMPGRHRWRCLLVLRVSAACEPEERPVAASHGKQDPQPVVGEGPEAGADPFDLLDDRVQALGGAIRCPGGVPGKDLASPALGGSRHASHLVGAALSAVVDGAFYPAPGELGLAVEGFRIYAQLLGCPGPEWTWRPTWAVAHSPARRVIVARAGAMSGRSSVQVPAPQFSGRPRARSSCALSAGEKRGASDGLERQRRSSDPGG
jgi:hypothetical protein